jgi:hypothetical protein
MARVLAEKAAVIAQAVDGAPALSEGKVAREVGARLAGARR